MKLKPVVTMCFYINNEQDLDLFWHKIERQNIGFLEMSLIYHIISEYLYKLDKKFKSFLNLLKISNKTIESIPPETAKPIF